MITIFASKLIPAMTVDPGIEGVDLAEALRRDWPADHHFSAYEPIRVSVNDGASTAIVRARTSPGKGENAQQHVFNTATSGWRMVALVGDIDDEEAHATKTPARTEWRADIEPKLDASGLAWYRTRGGARVLALLDEPFEIDSPARVAEWSARYVAWCDELAAQGIAIDRSCSDATRQFRLPRVVRDGVPTCEDLHGALVHVPLPVASVLPTTRNTEERDNAPERDRPAYDAAKYAVLGALGSWQEYPGRKNSVCMALGGMLRKMYGWSREDAADLVRNWLPAGVPGIDVENGVHTATKAWDKLPEECSGRAALDAVVGARAGAVIEQAILLPMHAAQAETVAVPVELATDPFGNAVDWGNDIEIPLSYLCKDLCLVPSDGKVAAVFGQPGAGKGPLADHFAACFALGEPILGAFACIKQRVLLLCFESARLTERRLRRMARAMGHAPRDLAGELWLYDCRAILDPCAPEFIELVRRTCAERQIGVVVLDSYTSATMSSGIDYMRPEYALLAKALGSIDGVLTICVAHGNKAGAESSTPRIKDLAYSGAFASLIETGIAVSKPESDDGTLIRVCCARAPETGFAPFHARFADVEGDGLAVTVDTTFTVRERGANLNPANTARADDKAARTLVAGKRIMASLTSDQCVKRAELRARAGSGTNAADAALAALVSAGLLSLVAGAYQMTAAGATADNAAIDAALGRVGSFVRA